MPRKPAVWIGAAMLVSSLMVYFPFRHDPAVLTRFWDGPLFLYVAKVFYNIPSNHLFASYNLPPVYFASHLPLYPLLIRILSWFTLGHYPVAMLLATLLCSVVSAVLFYRLLLDWKLVVSPVWTAFLFCFLPPRWLLYHSVGATEPLFLCLVFGTFVAFRAGRTWIVILCILLASLTKITGVLLLPVFGWIYFHRKEWRNLVLLPIASIGVFALFTVYSLDFGDFFAYFRWNAGEHKIIDVKPLEIFRLYAARVNFHSTELYLWTYLLYGLGTLSLWKHKELFAYSLVFFLFHCFVFHLDLSRYILVLAPFALLVGFDTILSKWPCRLFLPLLIYLDYVYVWGWIPFNLVNTETYARLLSFLGQ